MESDRILKEMVQNLLKERALSEERRRSFSIRDMTIPLILVVPILGSMMYGMIQLTTFYHKIDARFAALDNKIEAMTADRYHRTDAFSFCVIQEESIQIKYPDINLSCEKIFLITPSYVRQRADILSNQAAHEATQ